MDNRPLRVLPVIIVSQFAGTSLWFASNAVLPDLQRQLNIGADAVGIITSAVQFGFILGTLFFAFFVLADRFSPRILFFLCSLLGSFFNLLLYFFTDSLSTLLVLRFLTGFCLAGIYPVGMKIASGWYREGLGNALGFLVGALVVGTAFPHFLKSLGQSLDWGSVILSISALSAVGGVLMLLLVPDGPYLSKATPFNPHALKIIFQSREVRSATFGYFGHMWELYAFYAFVPFLIAGYSAAKLHEGVNISFWSFAIIAAGGLGCVGGGLLSKKVGSARIAWVQMAASGICCIVSPVLFQASKEIFLLFLLVWGVVVVGDSPQFSALVARYAPREFVGSALTIMNSIGFAITILSIQMVSVLSSHLPPAYLFLALAIGPALGVISLRPLTAKPYQISPHAVED